MVFLISIIFVAGKKRVYRYFVKTQRSYRKPAKLPNMPAKTSLNQTTDDETCSLEEEVRRTAIRVNELKNSYELLARRLRLEKNLRALKHREAYLTEIIRAVKHELGNLQPAENQQQTNEESILSLGAAEAVCFIKQACRSVFGRKSVQFSGTGVFVACKPAVDSPPRKFYTTFHHADKLLIVYDLVNKTGHIDDGYWTHHAKFSEVEKQEPAASFVVDSLTSALDRFAIVNEDDDSTS